MKNSKLTLMIFIALIAGVLVGWLFPSFGAKMQPLAVIFLNMIKMIIAPLLFSVLVTGIAGHGNIRSLGRLGLKTIIYFEVVTTIALFIGLFSGHFFQPGVGFSPEKPTDDIMNVVSGMAQTDVGGSTWDILSNILVHAFPTSIVESMASGDLLQIAVFAIFFAIAVCAIGQKAKPVLVTLPGFKCDIRGIKEFDKLPKEAQDYVLFIEKEIGVPITMVSNGPKRSEIIYR